MKLDTMLCSYASLALCFSTLLIDQVSSAAVARADSPSYPEPLQGTSNVEIRDPTILYNRETSRWTVAGTGPNIPLWTAPSLTGPWSQSDGGVLSGPSSINLAGRDGPWAPDLSYTNGKYYAWYSVSSFSTQKSAIGVAVSDTGKPNSFIDYGEQLRTRDGDAPNALDPNLAPGGQYLSYGSYFGGIYLARLNSPSSVDSSSLPGTHIAGGDGKPIEGSFIYQKNGMYYLFLSVGQCCNFDQNNLPAYGTSEYKVIVGRSNNIQGPYVDKQGQKLTTPGAGSTLISSFGKYYAPGGQSVYHDESSGKDIMVFHYSNPKNANAPAKLGIYYLDFSSGWPSVSNQ